MAVPSLDELGDRLGIVLKDPDAIHQAFVHSSYFNENPTAAAGHNERLEFLGDAVIGLIVSRLLYERFPDEDEGLLTARRAALVNRDALASLGLSIGLDRYLLLGRGESEAGGATRPSVLAGAFEALAGAIFMSEGLDVSRDWLRRLFDAPLPGADEPEPPKSAKSRLQEWTQREHRIKPHYELVNTTGPDHDQTFTVAAVLRGERIAIGYGSSRQRAEEQAAGAALDSLGASGIEV
jgi:ribonuclease-3